MHAEKDKRREGPWALRRWGLDLPVISFSEWGKEEKDKRAAIKSW